jgi:Protein of unknown function (DUF1326)
MMGKIGTLTTVVVLTATASVAGERGTIRGEYVEARTAEIFAGGCIMNSEAETAGRQAVLAWHITSGSVDGVALDGLTVVAAVAGDRNLGMREMGGEEPQVVRAIVTVDPAASEKQRLALVQLARDLSGGLIGENIVRVDVAPIGYTWTPTQVAVSTPGAVALLVDKEVVHDVSCGAMQWFKPFSAGLTSSAVGTAETHAFSGTGLGSKWSAPNKRSAFWGVFSY